MTVSDWGSAAAPFGTPRIQQGRYGRVHAQGHVHDDAAHPAYSGADPRYAPQRHDVAYAAPYEGGYPEPEPYGSRTHGAQGGSAGAAKPRRGGRKAAAAKGAGKRAKQGAGQGAGLGAGEGGPAALNVVGALVSLALIVGLGVSGYRLALRDVTGVPVVKALEGPMRIQPEDPGGAVAPHQGLAVNDVAAAGTSVPVDQLKLAPPVAELAAEDVPAHPLVEATRAAESPATAPLPSNGGEINADAAVAEALGLTDIPGLELSGEDDFGAEAPASATGFEVIPESVPGVTRSPRPMPRPASFAPVTDLSSAIDSAVDVVASADQPAPARPEVGSVAGAAAEPSVVLGREIAAEEVDPSARLVQLGAFQSPDEARAGWQEIATQNPALFDNRNWTIERRESGGTPFYRLRAIGFDGLQEARAFCAALVAAKGSCVPVVDTAGGTASNG